MTMKKNNSAETDKENLRLPAEWENHEATWIGWPHNKEDWPGKIEIIQWVYGEIVSKISQKEKVRIIVNSKAHEEQAKKVLQLAEIKLKNIEFYILPTNRGWLRDSGPAFVLADSKIKQVSFGFNAWAKYDNWKKDVKVPAMISEWRKLKETEVFYNNKRVVLEGGSIDGNGSGTLLTTEECLLDKKIQVRNPGFAKADYEKVFDEYLGVKKVIWLGKGIAGDDTHGHVDDLCRFVNANTVVLVQENDKKEKNYKPLNENRERLQGAKTADGQKLNTVYLPMPSPIVFDGMRLPASYANFYISNNAVLVPTFNDPNDRIALGILSELFEDRQVIGVHSVDLVWGLGTIHCLTHEQAAAPVKKK
jgi:agmatine deiminase